MRGTLSWFSGGFASPLATGVTSAKTLTNKQAVQEEWINEGDIL